MANNLTCRLLGVRLFVQQAKAAPIALPVPLGNNPALHLHLLD
jgi:hypothetical protein